MSLTNKRSLTDRLHSAELDDPYVPSLRSIYSICSTYGERSGRSVHSGHNPHTTERLRALPTLPHGGSYGPSSVVTEEVAVLPPLPKLAPLLGSPRYYTPEYDALAEEQPSAQRARHSARFGAGLSGSPNASLGASLGAHLSASLSQSIDAGSHQSSHSSTQQSIGAQLTTADAEEQRRMLQQALAKYEEANHAYATLHQHIGQGRVAFKALVRKMASDEVALRLTREQIQAVRQRLVDLAFPLMKPTYKPAPPTPTSSAFELELYMKYRIGGKLEEYELHDAKVRPAIEQIEAWSAEIDALPRNTGGQLASDGAVLLEPGSWAMRTHSMSPHVTELLKWIDNRYLLQLWNTQEVEPDAYKELTSVPVNTNLHDLVGEFYMEMNIACTHLATLLTDGTDMPTFAINQRLSEHLPEEWPMPIGDGNRMYTFAGSESADAPSGTAYIAKMVVTILQTWLKSCHDAPTGAIVCEFAADNGLAWSVLLADRYRRRIEYVSASHATNEHMTTLVREVARTLNWSHGAIHIPCPVAYGLVPCSYSALVYLFLRLGAAEHDASEFTRYMEHCEPEGLSLFALQMAARHHARIDRRALPYYDIRQLPKTEAFLRRVGNQRLLDIWEHQPLGHAYTTHFNWPALQSFFESPECAAMGKIEIGVNTERRRIVSCLLGVPIPISNALPPAWYDLMELADGALQTDGQVNFAFKGLDGMRLREEYDVEPGIKLTPRMLGDTLLILYETWTRVCPDVRIGGVLLSLYSPLVTPGHAEVLVIDRARRTVEIFDSNGSAPTRAARQATDRSYQFAVSAMQFIGSAVHVFANKMSAVAVATPSSTGTGSVPTQSGQSGQWQYVPAHQICPYIGPQYYEGDVDGEVWRDGYCTAFSRLYLILRITQPDIAPADLIKQVMACEPMGVVLLVRKLFTITELFMHQWFLTKLLAMSDNADADA